MVRTEPNCAQSHEMNLLGEKQKGLVLFVLLLNKLQEQLVGCVWQGSGSDSHVWVI